MQQAASEGVGEHAFSVRTGMRLDQALDPDILDQAIEADYLVRSAGRLIATLEGRLRLDALLQALVV